MHNNAPGPMTYGVIRHEACAVHAPDFHLVCGNGRGNAYEDVPLAQRNSECERTCTSSRFGHKWEPTIARVAERRVRAYGHAHEPIPNADGVRDPVDLRFRPREGLLKCLRALSRFRYAERLQ